MFILSLRSFIIHAIFVITLVTVVYSFNANCPSEKRLLEPSKTYQWTEVTTSAAFPGSYNFPLFNIGNRLWAFHTLGNWHSEDGRNWTKAELPPLGLRTGYQQYVQFKNSIYA